MRIAIDGLPLCQPLTGVGHYTLELASHLALSNPEDQISIVSPRRFLDAPKEPANLRCVRPTINPILRSWWQSNLTRYLGQQSIDIFHGTNFELPANPPCATVLTIHDLSTLIYPQLHEQKNVARAKRRLPGIAAAAALIVTPTEAIRHEVHEHLHIPLDRIIAVAEAARDCFRPLAFRETGITRRRLGIGDEFILYVGTVEPRKNLQSLVRAFEAIQDDHQQFQLVIAGKTGWMVEDLFKYVNRSSARDRIVFTGYLSDGELRALYSSCTLFTYPSIYEGFGLPPLEAMACGAPVVAGSIPSIREVVGNSACLVEPEPSVLTEAIRELLANPKRRQELAEKGRQRAAEFSWVRTAETMRELYLAAATRFKKL